MRSWCVLIVCGGCSFSTGFGTAAVDADVDGKPPIDASTIDAPPFATGAFTMVTRLAVSSTARDDDVTLTADMLEMFFESDRELAGQSDIYTARRATANDAWSLPSKIIELSTDAAEGSTNVSPDGLTLYFASNRTPSTTMDVYVSTRPDRSSAWSAPMLVSSLSEPSRNDYDAQAWSDTVLFLASDRGPAKGGSDLFRSTRLSAGAPWGTPALVPGLDTMMYEGEAFADATGAIWFTGNGAGDDDIWRSEPNGNGSYAAASLVMELDGPYADDDPWVSPDGHTIYFTSTRSGSLDIYTATR